MGFNYKRFINPRTKQQAKQAAQRAIKSYRANRSSRPATSHRSGGIKGKLLNMAPAKLRNTLRRYM